MSGSNADNDFLQKVNEAIDSNLQNGNFGVPELAAAIGLSRSSLLRKLKSASSVSANQYIRQYRLERSMEILSSGTDTVSEVAFRVGFSSTSYFIKCFREHYGYPPGETGKKEEPKGGKRVHRLVAIMFTDIEGYTALMQKDEANAILLRTRHRQIFKSNTKKYGGRILQYYGDGTLSTFSSAIDAVRCAIAMQGDFKEEPQIPVRIGIHSGDIIVTEEDIIGDGVNVASRIEALADAGGVCISAKVYDEVKNQSGIQTSSKGIFELKNVERPVEVFAVTNSGLKFSGTEEQTKVSISDLPEVKGAYVRKRSFGYKWLFLVPFVIIAAYLVYFSLTRKFETSAPPQTTKVVSGKSIAVLPFINDSADSSNVYIINGLMESILNNLQKIEDLRVVSRTSVEKYRNSSKSVREIAEELNVAYFVEGSGQKVGDEIRLSIQLIDAKGDSHLWSNQYTREVRNIFELQAEIAKSIAGEIEAVITPAEAKRIEKVYTNSIEAYDLFLKGLDLLYQSDRDLLFKAIDYFKLAIEIDDKFARAYAGVAIAYFFLDFGQVEKRYLEEMNTYADKALLYDPELAQSLIAKALYYMQINENGLALPHLEKALEYNPNSALVINILADFYTSYAPNTGKYLEYALKGIQLDIGANDSVSTSFIYLHVSNALVQAGFIKEADMYIKKSMSFDHSNLYAEYVNAYVQLAKEKDYAAARDRLIKALEKDSTRLDIMQEIGKIHYFMRDYKGAYIYYDRFMKAREAYSLEIYISELAKIAYVFDQNGEVDRARELMRIFGEFAQNDQSIYGDLTRCVNNAYNGEMQQALKSLRSFVDEEDFHYWTILLFPIDPVFDELKKSKEFQELYSELEAKFWNRHEALRKRLEKENLL